MDYVCHSPDIFSGNVFVAVAIYAVKVGQSGSRIKVDDSSPSLEDKIAIDEDRYWKGGMFYFNKEDPSIMVEKRFRSRVDIKFCTSCKLDRFNRAFTSYFWDNVFVIRNCLLIY